MYYELLVSVGRSRPRLQFLGDRALTTEENKKNTTQKRWQAEILG